MFINDWTCVSVIEIRGLESAVYCFAFTLRVMHMQSKDGTNTLAKDMCKHRTCSGKSHIAFAFLMLACRKATKYRKEFACK